MDNLDESAPDTQAAELHTPAYWRTITQTPAFDFAVASALHGWRDDNQLTGQEFESAIKSALTTRVG